MRRQEVNPSEILGLERGASWAEIRAAYRRLAKKHHADRNLGDETSVWIPKEVIRAFEQLRSIQRVHGTTKEPRWHERDSDWPSDTAQSERKAKQQRQRERRGWWLSSLKARFGVFAALAAAILVGIASTEDARTGDDHPTRASRLETKTAIEPATARRPDKGAAPRMPVPVARGSGSSPSLVRAGNGVSRSRGGQSASEVEREPQTTRPVRAPTSRQGSVDRSRAPERRNASPSAPDRPNRDGPSARKGGSNAGAALFMRVSDVDEVLRIQGTPTGIDSYSSSETW